MTFTESALACAEASDEFSEMVASLSRSTPPEAAGPFVSTMGALAVAAKDFEVESSAAEKAELFILQMYHFCNCAAFDSCTPSQQNISLRF